MRASREKLSGWEELLDNDMLVNTTVMYHSDDGMLQCMTDSDTQSVLNALAIAIGESVLLTVPL